MAQATLMVLFVTAIATAVIAYAALSNDSSPSSAFIQINGQLLATPTDGADSSKEENQPPEPTSNPKVAASPQAEFKLDAQTWTHLDSDFAWVCSGDLDYRIGSKTYRAFDEGTDDIGAISVVPMGTDAEVYGVWGGSCKASLPEDVEDIVEAKIVEMTTPGGGNCAESYCDSVLRYDITSQPA